MKRLFTFAALLSMTAVALSGCTDNLDETLGTGKGDSTIKKVGIIAHAGTPATRTVIGESEEGRYPVTWGDDEYIFFAEVYDGCGDFTISGDEEHKSESGVLSENHKSATFKLTKAVDVSGTFHTYYPYDAVLEYTHTSSEDYARLDFPRVQTPEAGKKIDPKGAVMYATTTCDGDSESIEKGFDLAFEHVAAYGHMTIKNFQSAMQPEGEIDYIRFIAKDGDYLSGEFYHGRDNDYTSEEQLCYSDVIIMNTNSIFSVGNDIDVWFTCMPNADSQQVTDFALRIKMKNGDEYAKRVDTGIVEFNAGEIAEFSMDWSKSGEKMETVSGDFVKITDVEQMVDGAEYVIVANYNGTNYALGSERGNAGSSKIEAKQVTVQDNKVISPSESVVYTITSSPSDSSSPSGYILTSHEGSYLNGSTSNTNLTMAATSFTWYIQKQTDGTFLLSTTSDTSGRCCVFADTNSGQFGSYARSNLSGTSNNITYYGYLDIYMKATAPGIYADDDITGVSCKAGQYSFEFSTTSEVGEVRVSDKDGIVLDASVSGNTVNYTIGKNTTDATRTGSIELTDGTYYKRVQIIQNAYSLDAPTITEVVADSNSIMAEWEAVEDAAKYKWAITASEAETPEQTLYKNYSGETEDAELEEESKEFEDGQYYLYVKSVAADGTESPWSEGFAFSVGDVSVTYTLTIDYYNFEKTTSSGSGYTPYNGTHTFTATATDDPEKTEQQTFTSYQIMPQNVSSNYILQWQSKAGYIYNTESLGTILSITIDYYSSYKLTVYQGNNSQPSSNSVTESNGVYNFSDGNGYFQISAPTSGTAQARSVTITYKK